MVTEDEQVLLGAVLNGYRDIPSLGRIVTAADFDQPIHGDIWQAMLDIHADGHTPDQAMVARYLGDRIQKLPGGASELFGMGGDPIPVNAPVYAKAVRQHAVRRRLADLGARLQQLPDQQDVEPDELLDTARGWLDAQLGRSKTGLTDISQAIEQVIETTEHGEPDATPTPWSDLNMLIDGWHPGNLITIGARPGIGKSITLENAATDTARTSRRVLFVSLEMSAKEITQRTLAHTAKVPLSKVRGRIDSNDPDMDRIAAACQTMGQANIVFADHGTQTMTDIRASAWEQKQAARRQGTDLGLVVVDYVQLITTQHPRLSRQQQVGEYTRGLKRLAKELNVPVLIAAQLNRGSENRTNPQPVMSDLREAGDIEQDSDIVILMHEETVDDGNQKLASGDIDLIVAKNRHGGTGRRTVQKSGHFAKLTGAAA